MKKSYDLADLVARYKAIGLDVGEAGAERLFDATFDWAEESAALTQTPFDDMAVGVLKPYRLEVKKKIDFNKDGQ